MVTAISACVHSSTLEANVRIMSIHVKTTHARMVVPAPSWVAHTHAHAHLDTLVATVRHSMPVISIHARTVDLLLQMAISVLVCAQLDSLEQPVRQLSIHALPLFARTVELFNQMATLDVFVLAQPVTLAPTARSIIHARTTHARTVVHQML